MVRLVFRPYTQVGRPICTSGPLRASTRVSSGFALPRHSSPSFGSRHKCSHSNLDPEGKWSVDCAARGIRSSLSLRTVVCHHRTRTCVRLLGPCFKTGCREPFTKPSHPPEPLPDKSNGFLRNMKRLGWPRPQGGGPRGPPEDDQGSHWLPTVPSQQFQALFDSLFKVLFIFPSRYLFAIGLAPVFSFRRNLPPT